MVRPAGLPDGWTIKVIESTANVWEVTALDHAGRIASAVGSDPEAATLKAVAGAADIQRQLDNRS